MNHENFSIKASDADRENVISALRNHMIAGRINVDELSQRMDRALNASTLENLEQLLSDLPTIVEPIPTPTTGRERAAAKEYQRSVTRWEQKLATKHSHLNLALGGGDVQNTEFICNEGERILARIPRTSLLIWTTTPESIEQRTTSRYSYNLFSGEQIASNTNTSQVPGQDQLSTADVGVVCITNRRIGFRGSKRSLDTLTSDATGINVESKTRRIVVSISNSRPVIYHYLDDDSTETATFAVNLALAYSRGTVDGLVASLESELAELKRSKPVLSYDAAENVYGKLMMRRCRRVALRARTILRSGWATFLYARQKRPDLLRFVVVGVTTLVVGSVVFEIGMSIMHQRAFTTFW